MSDGPFLFGFDCGSPPQATDFRFPVSIQSEEPSLCSTMGPMVALTFDVEASSTGPELEQAMPTVNIRKTIEIPVNNRIGIFLWF